MLTLFSASRRTGIAVVLTLVLTLSAVSLQVAQAAPVTGGDAVLAQLRLLGPSGAPLANSRVRVEIMPQYPARKTWGMRAWPLAGEGLTDAGGHMHVAMTYPAKSDPALYGNKDMVNLLVELVTPHGVTMPIAGVPRYLGSDPMRTAEFMHPLNLEDGAVHVSAETLAQAQALDRQAAARTASSATSPACFSNFYEVSNWAAYTNAQDDHGRWWDTNIQFTYTTQADTTIGEAFNSGPGGGFQLSGSSSITNGSGAGAEVPGPGGVVYAEHAKVQFQYGLYRDYICGSPTGIYAVFPDFWTGGMAFGDNISFTDDKPNQWTTALLTNEHWWKNNYVGYHYGTGASFSVTEPGGGSYGVTLDSQSNWTTTIR